MGAVTLAMLQILLPVGPLWGVWWVFRNGWDFCLFFDGLLKERQFPKAARAVVSSPQKTLFSPSRHDFAATSLISSFGAFRS